MSAIERPLNSIGGGGGDVGGDNAKDQLPGPPSVQPPSDSAPQSAPPKSTNFYVRAICINLFFMAAFAMFVIVVGVLFNMISPGSVIPPARSAEVPAAISVQHFQHVVQNGNKMLHHIRYIIPEATQMFQDTLRMFNELLYKATNIVQGVSTEPEDETIKTSTVDRRKREADRFSIFMGFENGFTERRISYSDTMERFFGMQHKTQVSPEAFDSIDLDPLNVADEDFQEFGENVREQIRLKRDSEIQFQQVWDDLKHCRQTNGKCSRLEDSLEKLMHDLERYMTNIRQLLDESNRLREEALANNEWKPDPISNVKVTTSSTTAPSPLPQTIPKWSVPFHEDLGRQSQSRHWTDSSKWLSGLAQRKLNPPIHKISDKHINLKPFKPLDNTGQGEEVVPGSAPFLSLCEQYIKQNCFGGGHGFGRPQPDWPIAPIKDVSGPLSSYGFPTVPTTGQSMPGSNQWMQNSGKVLHSQEFQVSESGCLVS